MISNHGLHIKIKIAFRKCQRLDPTLSGSDTTGPGQSLDICICKAPQVIPTRSQVRVPLTSAKLCPPC